MLLDNFRPYLYWFFQASSQTHFVLRLDYVLILIILILNLIFVIIVITIIVLTIIVSSSSSSSSSSTSSSLLFPYHVILSYLFQIYSIYFHSNQTDLYHTHSLLFSTQLNSTLQIENLTFNNRVFYFLIK